MGSRLTPDDLATCHMRERMHLNGGKEWFGYIHQCVEHPRLSRFDKYSRASKNVESTWRVDGKDCADLDAALLALAQPVELSADELAALIRWRDDFDGAWADRVKNYETMFALGTKGLIDGKNGITPADRRALQEHDPCRLTR